MHHPGYAGLEDGEALLARDAARLAVTARLDAARQVVAVDGGDAGEAVRHWGDALEVAVAAGTGEQVEREVCEAVLARTGALRTRGVLAEAVGLLELALPLLEHAPAGEELRRALSELLTDRGVQAGNAERWDACLDDLRRAISSNPDADRPRRNLATALQRRAGHRQGQGDRAGACALLREAMGILGEGSSGMSRTGFARQIETVREDLRSLRNGWAVSLAADGAFEDALGVLADGLVELPADAVLRNSQRGVFLAFAMRLRDDGKLAEAGAVLERGLRSLPADSLLVAARARLDSGAAPS